jgi:hypothetical protein
MHATLRSLVLGLALPARHLTLKGASVSHPPCGGPPPTSRRWCVSMVETQDAQHVPSQQPHSQRAVAPPPNAAVAEQLLAGMQRALDDRRRVDELVTHFEYSGVVSIPAEAASYEGQGAVKRFLTTLLFDNTVRSTHLDANGVVVVSLSDAMGRPRELHLRATSRGAVVAGTTLINELHVSEEGSSDVTDAPIFAVAPATVDGDRTGPKWETFDGRVRQRIWQVSDQAHLRTAPFFAPLSFGGGASAARRREPPPHGRRVHTY